MPTDAVQKQVLMITQVYETNDAMLSSTEVRLYCWLLAGMMLLLESELTNSK